jgi:vacuolar iron transporter family protein
VNAHPVLGKNAPEAHMRTHHHEFHRIENIGWLRAAVLGANDGIVSTASLVLGVAAADAAGGSVLVAGVAGLVAGAMSMATGEYVSVSSQADAEKAALNQERNELSNDYEAERRELTAIYVSRGLEPVLAQTVADQLMAHDALGAHARDELWLSKATAARPLQAAAVSAASFAAGACLPLAVVALAPASHLLAAVSAAALIALAVLGGLAARIGGARVVPGVARVVAWSALAMGATYGIGALVGRAM